MTNINISKDPIEHHLTVSGLIQNIVRKLGARTIGKLCEIDIKAVKKVKGVGAKKVTEFSRLINKARELSGLEVVPNVAPKIDLSGTVFDPTSSLIYVPNILKVLFDHIGVNTVDKLLSLSPSDIDNLPGLGHKKKAAVLGMKELYTKLATTKAEARLRYVGDLVPPEVLPTESLGRMLLSKFLAGQNGDALRGKAFQEADDLRMLINWVLTPRSESSNLNEMEWRDIPLQIGPRNEAIADRYNLKTMAQISDFAVYGCVVDPKSKAVINITQETNFGIASLTTLRKELSKLSSKGLDRYRFGEAGIPKTFKGCVNGALNLLDWRQREIVKDRYRGKTLFEIAQDFSISRERARQIADEAFTRLKTYRLAARKLLARAKKNFPKCLLLEAKELRAILNLDQTWQLDFLIELADFGYERYDANTISIIPKKSVHLLSTTLRKLIHDDYMFSIGSLTTVGRLLQLFKNAYPDDALSISPLESFTDCHLEMSDLRTVLGNSWLLASIRSQIVESGVNGIAFEDIDTSGFFTEPSELERFLGKRAVRLDGDIFRRRIDYYKSVDEIVKIVRDAHGPVDMDYILARSKRKWYKEELIGRLLTPLFEIVNTSRGLYIHIKKLNLTVSEVKQISNWGAKLITSKMTTFDSDRLFKLYRSSKMPQKLDSPFQLVSIVAKHPDIRRLPTNLKLAHRASFDESELSLAKADPNIAAQWHPTKNGTFTAANVRPYSNKPRWWKCEKGHEFEATPIYRIRVKRACPECKA